MVSVIPYMFTRAISARPSRSVHGLKVRDLQLLPGEDHGTHNEPVDPRIAVAGSADQRTERRRCLVQDRHTLLDQQVEELLRRAGDREGDDDQASAE
ncbi:hypothetical protein SMICM304S_02662 [Streptomyces microflavus]